MPGVLSFGSRQICPVCLDPHGLAAVTGCVKESELSSIDYSRSSSRRFPLPLMTRGALGNSKEAGEA
jgi:hypothetical protein